MSSSPSRPAQSVSNVAGRHCDHGGEQVLDLVAGHPDQPGWWWVAAALGHGGGHQEGVGDHGEGDPAVPGAPAADLMLVQADQPLAGLEPLLDGPPGSGHPDQGRKRGGLGRVAAVEGQFPGALVAADQPMPPGLVAVVVIVVKADERPVVEPVALGALAARHLLPGPRRDLADQGVSAVAGPPASRWTRWSQATATTYPIALASSSA